MWVEFKEWIARQGNSSWKAKSKRFPYKQTGSCMVNTLGGILKRVFTFIHNIRSLFPINWCIWRVLSNRLEQHRVFCRQHKVGTPEIFGGTKRLLTCSLRKSNERINLARKMYVTRLIDQMVRTRFQSLDTFIWYPRVQYNHQILKIHSSPIIVNSNCESLNKGYFICY
jgi:hypothetical protein